MAKENETAEAIWIVIKRLLKWGLIFLVGLIALLGLIFSLLFYLQDRQSRERRASQDLVKVSAAYDKVNCDKDYPYLYWVKNESQRTVEKVDFTVQIRRRGYSSALNRYTSLTEDKILRPGDEIGGCFRAVKDGEFDKLVTETDVDIVIDFKIVTFQ